MSKTFLSYAHEDNALSMHIYEDLRHSGLTAWRYEVDGEIGVDFLEEIKEQIETSEFFCLLDSPYARDSIYVRRECRIAIASRKSTGSPRILICSTEPKGRWTNKRELFRRQRFIRHIAFSDYEVGIKELCNFLGANYRRFFEMPTDHDFEEEIYMAAGIDIKASQRLLDDYGFFRKKYDQDKRVAECLLVIIILKCEEDLKTQVVSPHIALGVLQAEVGRHRDALETFTQASEKFPSDPRVWAGIGGAEYHLSSYDAALKAYKICRRLINESNDKNHESHVVEVVHNLASVLVAVGRLEQARSELDNLPKSEQQRPEILALNGRILMKLGDLGKARRCLERAFEGRKDPSLILDLSECYEERGEYRKQYELLNQGIQDYAENAEIARSLGVYFANHGQLSRAVASFEKAVSLSPNEIKYRAELALLLYEIGNKHGEQQQVEIGLSLPVVNYAERYYLGLIYYLIDKRERARDEFNEAKRDEKVADWVYYDQLVKKR